MVTDFEHGASGYTNHKCRCDECRDGHAAQQRQWRSNKRRSELYSKKFAKVAVSEWPYTVDEWLDLSPDEFWWCIAVVGDQPIGLRYNHKAKRKRKPYAKRKS